MISEGLSGAASMRTTTSSAAGFGTAISSSQSSNCPLDVILVRNSRLLIVVIVIALLTCARWPTALIAYACSSVASNIAKISERPVSYCDNAEARFRQWWGS
jgi:hypothetical protein